jgi:hypothetical protein
MKLPGNGEKSSKKVAGCNYLPCKADPCISINKAIGDEPISFVIILMEEFLVHQKPLKKSLKQ